MKVRQAISEWKKEKDEWSDWVSMTTSIASWDDTPIEDLTKFPNNGLW